MQIDMRVIQEMLGDKELQILFLRSEITELKKRILELEKPEKEIPDGHDSKSH